VLLGRASNRLSNPANIDPLFYRSEPFTINKVSLYCSAAEAISVVSSDHQADPRRKPFFEAAQREKLAFGRRVKREEAAGLMLPLQ
jgi:hypothetical protein